MQLEFKQMIVDMDTQMTYWRLRHDILEAKDVTKDQFLANLALPNGSVVNELFTTRLFEQVERKAQ